MSILIVLCVFGDLLLHGVWDSFADSPYGIIYLFIYYYFYLS